MIKEAIILAGGLGTRLRPVIPDVPKCMAPINGKPFLYYLLENFKNKGVENFIFSVGHLHEMIEKYLAENYGYLNYKISLETEPLGTGGAIKSACGKASQEKILVCNGDTFYNIDVDVLYQFHEEKKGSCSLCLKPMHNFDRYGAVELNSDYSIKSFKEKKFYTSGLINGGIYALRVSDFLKENLPEKFSFEKDYLENNIQQPGEKQKLFGIIQDKYFIDIGIPGDYEKAQRELLFTK